MSAERHTSDKLDTPEARHSDGLSLSEGKSPETATLQDAHSAQVPPHLDEHCGNAKQETPLAIAINEVLI